MKLIITIFFWVIAILGGIYIALWWGIVQPIVHVASLIDAGTLTATAVAMELLKFFFREILAVIWIVGFLGLGGVTLSR
jgi:hypothetical protein